MPGARPAAGAGRAAKCSAGRVVRAGDEHHVGSVLGDRGDRGVDVEGEVRRRGPSDPLGVGAVGDDRVHRVRRVRSPTALRPGPPKACSSCCRISLDPLAAQTLSTLERHAGLHGQVRGQVGAQRDRVPVGVAVQVDGHVAHGRGDVVDQRRRRRVRVLVGVQPDRDRRVRCAVGRLAAQVVAQR